LELHALTLVARSYALLLSGLTTAVFGALFSSNLITSMSIVPSIHHHLYESSRVLRYYQMVRNDHRQVWNTLSTHCYWNVKWEARLVTAMGWF